MQQSSVDLTSLFRTATQNLAANQEAINQADDFNGNHGTNMVQTFQMITESLEKKRGSSTGVALNYAAKQVSRRVNSGSGQIYAQNLSQAASQAKGKQIDERGALELLQTLIGGQAAPAAVQPAPHPAPQQPQADDEMLGAMLGSLGTNQAPAPQAAQGGGDMLGALLGGLSGSQASGQQTAGAGSDMLGSLLGGLMGGQTTQASPQGGGQSGLDLGDLVNAAMAFMQAKQGGGNTTQALMQAFMAGSGMGRAPHRQQSTGVVVSSFLQALGQGG